MLRRKVGMIWAVLAHTFRKDFFVIRRQQPCRALGKGVPGRGAGSGMDLMGCDYREMAKREKETGKVCPARVYPTYSVLGV